MSLEDVRSLEFGVWSLEFGVWSLEFGVWSLEFGVWSLERAKGIEPSYRAWEALVLPLNYAREEVREAL